jgi:hypothetical protein
MLNFFLKKKKKTKTLLENRFIYFFIESQLKKHVEEDIYLFCLVEFYFLYFN